MINGPTEVGLFSGAAFLAGLLLGRLSASSRTKVEAASSKNENDTPTEIYVGNLSYGTTERDLRKSFGCHGKVRNVRLIRNRANGRSKGYGFVQMGAENEAKSVIKAFNGKNFKGRKIVVNEAKSDPKKD